MAEEAETVITRSFLFTVGVRSNQRVFFSNYFFLKWLTCEIKEKLVRI